MTKKEMEQAITDLQKRVEGLEHPPTQVRKMRDPREWPHGGILLDPYDRADFVSTALPRGAE